MKSTFFLPVAIFAAAAAAQTTSRCAADYIVETCLNSEKAKLASCKAEDWNCKCAAWEAILTCYNNCPNDPNLHVDAGQKEIFCGYASQFQSTTIQPIPTPSVSGLGSVNVQTTEPPTNQDDVRPSGSQTPSASATPTNSAATVTGSNAAVALAYNAGSVLVGVAGAFAVWL